MQNHLPWYYGYNIILHLDLIRSYYSVTTHIVRSPRFRLSVNYGVIIIIYYKYRHIILHNRGGHNRMTNTSIRVYEGLKKTE